MSSNEKDQEQLLAQNLQLPYACIFIDEAETELLKSQELQPFLWLCFIGNIFSTWVYGENKLTQFLNKLNNFYSQLKLFTYETSICTVNFLDVNVNLKNVRKGIKGNIQTFTINQRMVTSTSTSSLLTPYTLRP